MDDDDQLQLRLLGPAGHMDARALQQALGALLDLMHDAAASQSPQDLPTFVISDLRTSSALVAVRPSGIVEREALDGLEHLTRGVSALEQGVGVPDAWTEDMVRNIITIGSVTKMAGVEGAELSWHGHPPVRLDTNVLLHAEASLSEKRISLGSVRGRLHRWFDHRSKHEVGLIDEGTGRAVTITVPPHLVDRTLQALNRTVLAWGEIRRNTQGDKLRLAMEDFEVVDDRPSPRTEDMAGILGKDWTGGASSVEWVRAQRDG